MPKGNLLAVVVAMLAGLSNAGAVDPHDQSGVPLEVEPKDPALVKIVLVAGKPSHPPLMHEYFAGMALLSQMLKQTPGAFPVMVRDGWPKNEKIFEGAKAVVFFSDGRNGHPIVQPERMALLQKLMDQGAGFVNLHYSVDYPTKDEEKILSWLGGYYDERISTNPHWTADFKSLPEHPITRGVKPFSMLDEWYYNLHFVPSMKNVTPILQAVPPDSSRKTEDAKKHPGRSEVLAWAYERVNKGRSFGFTGCHYHKNWGDENFRRTVVNGILWSAKMEIPKDGAKVALDPADLNKNLDKKMPKKKPGK